MSNTLDNALQRVIANDDRPPEQLTEDERMARYLHYAFVLEAVVPSTKSATSGKRDLIGRCPWQGPMDDCRARAREMMAGGKDIAFVRIRDTRSWRILEVERR